MSTTTTPLSVIQATLRDVMAAMLAGCPSMTAAPGEVANWFERCVQQLAPITRDRSHPEHDDACSLAAKYSHDAIALRASAQGKEVTR